MTTAFLALDLMNDIVDPEGPSRQTFAAEVARRNVLENAAFALDRARRAHKQVIYVKVGFSDGYPECPTAPWSRFARAREVGIFKLGQWGTEIHRRVAPQAGDAVIVKHRVSPFYATTLEPILHANAVDTLVVFGVSTNAVVQAAVREGHDRDYRMILLEDCCSALNAEEHESSVRLLTSFATITTSKALDL